MPIVYTPSVNHTVTDFDINIRRNNGAPEDLSFDIQAGGSSVATTDLVSIGTSSTSFQPKWTLNAPFEFIAGTAYTLIPNQTLTNFVEATVENGIPEITATGVAGIPPSILFNGTEEVSGTAGTFSVWTYEDGTQRAFNDADNTEVDITGGLPVGWTLCPEVTVNWTIEDITSASFTINDGVADKQWRANQSNTNQNITIDNNAYAAGSRLIISRGWAATNGTATFDLSTGNFNDGSSAVPTLALGAGENYTLVKQSGGNWDITSRYPGGAVSVFSTPDANGKVAVFEGDIDVDGTIDPDGMVFDEKGRFTDVATAQAYFTGKGLDFSKTIWVNPSDNKLYLGKSLTGATVNFSESEPDPINKNDQEFVYYEFTPQVPGEYEYEIGLKALGGECNFRIGTALDDNDVVEVLAIGAGTPNLVVETGVINLGAGDPVYLRVQLGSGVIMEDFYVALNLRSSSKTNLRKDGSAILDGETVASLAPIFASFYPAVGFPRDAITQTFLSEGQTITDWSELTAEVSFVDPNLVYAGTPNIWVHGAVSPTKSKSISSVVSDASSTAQVAIGLNATPTIPTNSNLASVPTLGATYTMTDTATGYRSYKDGAIITQTVVIPALNDTYEIRIEEKLTTADIVWYVNGVEVDRLVDELVATDQDDVADVRDRVEVLENADVQGLASTQIDASATATTETLAASTNAGVVRLFTNADVTNAATLAVRSGETLNGVTDGTFLFSNYSAGTQFRADEATGGWVVSVVGAADQTSLSYVSISDPGVGVGGLGAGGLDLDATGLLVLDDDGLIDTATNRIVVKNTGRYEAFFDTAVGSGEQSIYIRKNGSRVAEGRADDGSSHPSTKVIIDMAAGDYFDFEYTGSNGNRPSVTVKQLPTSESVLAGMLTPTDNFMRAGSAFSTDDANQTFAFDAPFDTSDGTSDADIEVFLQRKNQPNLNTIIAPQNITVNGFDVDRDNAIDGVGTTEPFSYVAFNRNQLGKSVISETDVPVNDTSSTAETEYNIEGLWLGNQRYTQTAFWTGSPPALLALASTIDPAKVIRIEGIGVAGGGSAWPVNSQTSGAGNSTRVNGAGTGLEITEYGGFNSSNGGHVTVHYYK